MTRQQLRLALCDIGELAFENFRDEGVQRPSVLAQQRAVRRVLNKGVLEEVGRIRRRTLAGQQPGLKEPVERRIQLRLGRSATKARSA